MYNVISNFNVSEEDIMTLIINTFYGKCLYNKINDNDIISNLSITKLNIKMDEAVNSVRNLIINKLIDNQDKIIDSIKEKINLFIENNQILIDNYQNRIKITMESLKNSKHQDVVDEIILDYNNMISNIKNENLEYSIMLEEINNILNDFLILKRKCC